MDVQGAHECAEPQQHKARRLAETDAGAWAATYQATHGLSNIDMIAALQAAQAMILRYLERDDEERRTGFRHRMAGE